MSGTKGAFSGEKRNDRLIHEHVHDPYQNRKNLPEPACCPECSAVLEKGRWRRGEKPTNSHEATCPACSRTRDNCPAGIIRLSGNFLAGRGEELINLARNEEVSERAEHPLHRIMAIDDGKDKIEIRTTDIHLPRRIGHALERAFDGTLEINYDKEAYFVRVNWNR